LFQVTDPTGQVIWPYLLALHVNPQQFDEKMQKSKTVTMTWGGFVEFHWPDELGSLSATATTGAFIGPNTGLTAGSDAKGSNLTGQDSRVGASGRHGTMAWERQEDLLDLFRNNGLVYNGFGEPILRGQVMCIYDRGIYVGHFTTFSVKETDEKAFSFELDWEFKIEDTVYIFPASATTFQGPLAHRSRLEAEQADVREVRELQSEFEEGLDDPNVDENTPAVDQTQEVPGGGAGVSSEFATFATPQPTPDELAAAALEDQQVPTEDD
jgi:hypothetical protein